mgnify:CR=1 FL=1
MKLITESPEHHFLTTLEKLRQDAAGWVGMHFALSQRLDHNDVIGDPAHIAGKLSNLRREAASFAAGLEKEGAALAGAFLYLFADCDVVLLVSPEDEEARKKLQILFKSTAAQVGDKIAAYSDLAKGIYDYQKLADQRMIGAKRFKAYEDMADANRVASIPLRRQRRDDALVLIVEDDRFTSSYAANILNKEYEMVLARSGEEAVSYYIEHAPDIVFLDIHLPGLTGHDTLRALRAVDPEASVVMLSVDTARENVMAAGAKGASGFLKKPFSKERMLHIVRSSQFVKNRKRGRR